MSFDLICFLNQDFPWQDERGGSRIGYLMHTLARLQPDCRILCVERPLWSPSLGVKADIRSRLKGTKKAGLRQYGRNMFFYRPPFLLPESIAVTWQPASQINRSLLAPGVRRSARELGLGQRKLVSWVCHPSLGKYLDLLRADLRVYDCDDDYVAHGESINGRLGARIEEAERRLLSRVDLVFAASEPLAARLRAHGTVRLLPNAVDAGLFCGEQKVQAIDPPDLRPIPRPRLGIVGGVNSRIDFGLLEHLCRRHPEWSLVLVGPVSHAAAVGIGGLGLSNLHTLGRKSFDALPGYLAGMDACLIAYVRDRANFHCSPMRLFEYLSSGRPIVSVDLPFVAGFEPVVRVGRSHEEFEREIGHALGEAGQALAQERRRVALNNTWEVRADTVFSAMDGLLADTAVLSGGRNLDR